MRIVYYSEFPFHRTMLERPYKLGLHSSTMRSTWAEGAEELLNAKPDIVVFSDDVSDKIRAALSSRTIYVFTRHGFSSKNILRKILRRCSIVCVSSDWVKSDICQRYLPPLPEIWVTGFTATDIMWERLNVTRQRDQRSHVLYAPTWDPNLSAHPVVGTSWAREWLTNPQNKLIVKFHPHSVRLERDWVREWLALAKAYPRQLAIPDPDSNIYSFMSEADLLITDTSSVMFYWLALDRPVILVDPKGDHNYWLVDLQGPEWTWRDMGWNVNNAASLLDAIQEAFKHPHRHSNKREVYRQRVFGDHFDGKASQRLVDNLDKLAQSKTI